MGYRRRVASGRTPVSNQWRSHRERGSIGLIRLIIWIALHAGRSVCRVLLVPICIYFFLAAPLSRRASHEFLSRALGRRARWRDTFRHLIVFSTTLLDRIYLLHGRQREWAIDINNEAAFWNALSAGRGCLLFGSHLGSFEMLAIVGSAEKKLSVNMVMHVDDSARLGSLMLGKRSALPYKVIALGQPGAMLQVKECLDRGEVVGILADRVYGNEATQSLPFLGSAARFSLSPFRLARITGAPVLSVFGLRHSDRHYEIGFEALADRVDDPGSKTALPPSSATVNAVSLERCLAAYVESLERQARRCPYNWFNFYDYWKS